MTKSLLMALVLLAAACTTADAPTLGEIGICSAGPGSAFLPYAQGVARHAGASGLKVTALETTGSIDNIRRISAEPDKAATVFMGSAYEAWTGSGAWTNGRKFDNLRALFPMYETSFQMAALASSGITTLRQLEGRRVGVGPAGGPAEVYFKGLADAVGLKAAIVNGQPAAMVKDLLEGRIAALWQGSPPPIPSLVEVQKAAPATVFALTAAEQGAMLKRFPFLAAASVPPGTYQGQTAPLASVAAWNFVLVNKDFPVADAYLLTRVVMSATDPRKQIYAPAGNTRAASARANTFLPFHPGALKYYREAGIDGLTVPGN